MSGFFGGGGSGTTNASDLTTGTVALARGGTGADLSATGGSGQVLKQTTSGGAVSVAAIAAGDLPTGIDAANIHDGSVSNTEFSYLNGVTSAIQTQLDAAGGLSQAGDVSNGIEIYGVDSADKVTVSVDASGNATFNATGGRYNFDATDGDDLLSVYRSGGDTYWQADAGHTLYIYGGDPVVFRVGAAFPMNLYSNRILQRVPTNQLHSTIAASTTQSQGQGAINETTGGNFVLVTTCANANDVITLPANNLSTANANRFIWIKNEGAETLQIYPASGDNLGQGVNTSTTLASGSAALFWATGTDTWSQLI